MLLKMYGSCREKAKNWRLIARITCQQLEGNCPLASTEKLSQRSNNIPTIKELVGNMGEGLLARYPGT